MQIVKNTTILYEPRNQKFFKLRTTCKAKAAGGHYCLQRPFFWLSQNSTNLII